MFIQFTKIRGELFVISQTMNGGFVYCLWDFKTKYLGWFYTIVYESVCGMAARRG